MQKLIGFILGLTITIIFILMPKHKKIDLIYCIVNREKLNTDWNFYICD